MKERIQPMQLKTRQQEDPEEAAPEQIEDGDRGSGRTFEGVAERPEKFSTLEKGKDYELVRTNPAVETNQPIDKYFLFVNPSGGTETRLASPPHWRSVSTPDFSGSVRIEPPNAEATHEPFFEANTKGIGYLKPSARGASVDEQNRWMVKDNFGAERFGYKMLGLAKLGEFESTDEKPSLIDRSMHLLGAGLRTETYWGIAKLNNVIYKGQPTSIQELRDKRIITSRKTFEPALAVRLFKTNSRVEEAYRDDSRRHALFDKAFDVYNKEQRAKHSEDPRELHRGNIREEREFFATFCERMGTNLAVLFNEGIHCLYLHSSNITLAAEIADIGTMANYRDEKQKDFVKKHGGVRFGHLKDTRDIMYTLRYLSQAARADGLHTSTREALYNAFMKGFRDTLDPEQLRQRDTDPQKADAWVSQIAETVLVRRERLVPLVSYEIEDWPIKGPEESE